MFPFHFIIKGLWENALCLGLLLWHCLTVPPQKHVHLLNFIPIYPGAPGIPQAPPMDSYIHNFPWPLASNMLLLNSLPPWTMTTLPLSSLNTELPISHHTSGNTVTELSTSGSSLLPSYRPFHMSSHISAFALVPIILCASYYRLCPSLLHQSRSDLCEMWMWEHLNGAYKSHHFQDKVCISQHTIEDPSFSEPLRKSQFYHSLFCPWTPCFSLAKLPSFRLLCMLLALLRIPFGLLVPQHQGIITIRMTWAFSIPVHTFYHIHQVSLLNTSYGVGTMLTSGHSNLPSQR